MPDHRAPLYAYYATLAAICFISTLAAILAIYDRNIEASLVAAGISGLIGVVKLPSSRSVTVDNAPSDPVPVAAREGDQ